MCPVLSVCCVVSLAHTRARHHTGNGMIPIEKMLGLLSTERERFVLHGNPLAQQ